MDNFEDIKSAAEDMFGADNVDLQKVLVTSPSLVIHWDEVEVSNEYNEKHTIYDVYIKVNFTENAKLIGFEIARSTLTDKEMRCGYVFSHTYRQRSDIIQYMRPCVGNGPIKTTMTTLGYSYDSDIFRLFLVELDRYIRTESVSGGPYIRIREIGNRYSLQYSIHNINLNSIPADYIVNLYNYIKEIDPIKPVSSGRYSVDFGLTIPFVCRITKDTVEYLRHKKDYNKSDVDLYLTRGSFTNDMIYIDTYSDNVLIKNIIGTSIYFKGKNVDFKKIVTESDGCTYIVNPDVSKGIITLLYRDYFIK